MEHAALAGQGLKYISLQPTHTEGYFILREKVQL